MNAVVEKEIPPPNTEEKGSVEIKLDNGEVLTFPTIRITRKKLYHGSRAPGLEELAPAEEDTVGHGVYLTSEAMWAAGYAHVRTNDPQNRTVYETEVENLTLVDLTNQRETMPLLAKLMAQELIKYKKSHPFNIESMDKEKMVRWAINENANRILETIREGKIRYPKDLLFHFGKLASTKLASFGLDGIKAIEGGEGGNQIRIGNHDTYVIFDPEKVRITGETQIQPYQHEAQKAA